MNIFFKHKRFIIYLFISLVIFTFTNSIFVWYLEKVTPKLNKVVESKLEKVTYEIIMNNINDSFIEAGNLEDILNITRNSSDEILMIDYNLEKAYVVNNLINDQIRNNINNLEYGNYNNNEFLLANNSMYLEEPLFISSDYAIISSLGPKIPIKISFIGTLITNLKTKVTDYGLNNALVELYVVVELEQLITTPVVSESIRLEYDILIDAIMVNGRVPTFYGNDIVKESNLLDIPL